MTDTTSSVTTTTSTLTNGTTSYTWTSGVSDIDWDTLIEAEVAERTARADTIDVEISDNEVLIESYSDMQALLATLSDAAYLLSAPSGTTNSDYDVFASRAAYTTSDGSTDADSAVYITVEDGTDVGSFDLTVSQLATAHKVASDAVSADDEELGYAGVFSVQLGDGDTIEIDVDETMTLDEIAEAINAEGDESAVQASVVKVSDDSYQLVIYGTETGEDLTLSAVSGDDVLTGLGILDSEGAFDHELQAAQNAIFTYDGIEISRSTNDIDDLIDGVTINLYETTGDDTITVEISEDADEIKDAIIALAEAYNAYREWALTQQETSTSGEASDDAALFGDATLRSANSSVYSALSTIIDGDSMALLGLSYDESNYLVLDEDTLNDALLNSMDEVRSLLAFEMDSSDSDLTLLAHDNNGSLSFTLDITVDEDGAITSVSVDGDDSLFEVSGTRIKGAEGTDYEGLTFVFLGEASTSIDVTTSSGIAEALYSATSAVSDDTDGTLQTIIDNLEDVNDDLEERSDDIRTRAETYRDALTLRYANYQASIEETESTLDYLEALLQAMYSS